jgi:hypothetical protein
VIMTKDLKCFTTFVADVESAKVPFRIMGYQKDRTPMENFYGNNKPPRSFTARLVLCSSIATVMFNTTMPIEEASIFDDFLQKHNVQIMEKLELKDGVILCE